MTIEDFDPVDDDGAVGTDQEPVIDLDDDVVVRSEVELGDADDVESNESARSIDNAVLDNILDELVDLVNGRDLDGVSDTLAPDVESEFLAGSSREEVVDGFNELFLRNPSLLATRADLDSGPIVVLWIFDHESDRFDPFGYMTFELEEVEDGSISRIDFVDELPDSDDLVIEYPERSDLPEWEEWSDLNED